MHIKSLLTCIILSLAAGLTAAPKVAQAKYCEGVVRGLSSRYNAATGSGFLAIRELPNGASAKLAELFNDEKVQVTGRKGNWYQVIKQGGSDEGWVSVRWMHNSCDY